MSRAAFLPARTRGAYLQVSRILQSAAGLLQGTGLSRTGQTLSNRYISFGARHCDIGILECGARHSDIAILGFGAGCAILQIRKLGR